MSLKKSLCAALICVAGVSSVAWGQCDTWTTSTIKNCNGIDYELWNQNNSGTVSMKITGGSTNANGGTFEATWNGTENILTRAGKKWGSSSTTTPRSVGNITLDFAATWSSSDNVKMLGVYGWAYYPAANVPTKTESGTATSFSNQIEYYIIQDRGSYNPASGGTNAKNYGSATIDGIEYDFWVADRLNQPMLTGNGNFKQYFSVPKSTSSHRQSGTVSISKHFSEWEKAGMKILDCPLYEVAMKVESYTGTASGKGSAKVTKNLLTLGGSGSSSEFSLATSVSPAAAGTVTKSPDGISFAAKTSVALTATANSGWKFVGWVGDTTSAVNPITVSMSKDRSLTAKFELTGESSTNLLKDGDFPSGSVISTGDGTSWKLGQGKNWGNSVATASVSGGTATIDVTTIGTEAYQPQLVQYGLALDTGMTYKLTFKASADVARSIEASFQQSEDPWATYASEKFDLTTTEKEYEFVFTMNSTSDAAAQFAFNIGQVTGKVNISDVKLVYASSTTGIFRGMGSRAANANGMLVSVKNRTLSVSPVRGVGLQVRVIDVNGKVRASFNVGTEAEFSLSNIPSGLYFIDVKGIGVKLTKPVVLE